MGTIKQFIMIAYFACLLVNISHECGPGPSFSRLKILKPMVLYQRLPDVDEESIGGSGMFRHMITENSKEYKELVRNYNKDIVFESGDGKRTMTKRCKEKLDKLAKLVKHEWPNVKLRVIQAYDKYGQHPPNSLHYEARAVDITTSDRDKSKIGNLGSLAYQAGFDWVYYESHSYIHASVVSESEVNLKQADCFPNSAKVYSLEHGPIEMIKLSVGDHVLTKGYIKGHFQEFYTEVIGFLDHLSNITQPYLVLKTENGLSIAATKSHLLYTISNKSSSHCNEIFVNENAITEIGMTTAHIKSYQSFASYSDDKNRPMQNYDMVLNMDCMENIINIKPAYSVAVGDQLIIVSNSIIQTTKITEISIELRKGAIAPLTMEGNIIVNNILASCYAKLTDAKLAHAAFVLYRNSARLLPVEIRQTYLDWYVAFLREVNDLFGIALLYY